MIVDETLRKLLQSGAARKICIKFPDGEYPDITENIYSDSIQLIRILNNEMDLDFGECNSSYFTVQVGGISDIKNLKIMVYAVVDGYKKNVPLFTGWITEARLNSNTFSRTIEAYDALLVYGNTNVTEWYENFFGHNQKPEYKGLWSAQIEYLNNDVVLYNGKYYRYIYVQNSFVTIDGAKENVLEYISGKTPDLLVSDPYVSNYIQELLSYDVNEYESHTVKEFRDSLFSEVGITQKSVSLPNDKQLVTHTIYPNEIHFIDCIKAVCQINACFGQMNEEGVFEYVFLNDSEIDVTKNIRAAETTFDEYPVPKIDGIRVFENEEIIYTVGTCANPWDVKNNFLLYSGNISSVVDALLNIVNAYQYTNAAISLILSTLVNVGSSVSFVNMAGNKIKAYVLKDTLSGAQLIHEGIQADGYGSRKNESFLNSIAFTKDNMTLIYQSIDAVNALAKEGANKAQNGIDGIEIGARNLIINSKSLIYKDYHFTEQTEAYVDYAVVGTAICS